MPQQHACATRVVHSRTSLRLQSLGWQTPQKEVEVWHGACHDDGHCMHGAFDTFSWLHAPTEEKGVQSYLVFTWSCSLPAEQQTRQQ